MQEISTNYVDFGESYNKKTTIVDLYFTASIANNLQNETDLLMTKIGATGGTSQTSSLNRWCPSGLSHTQKKKVATLAQTRVDGATSGGRANKPNSHEEDLEAKANYFIVNLR